MIRITELKLPLDHAEAALPELIARTLGIAGSDLLSHTIYKRSYDARMKKLLLVYIADVAVAPALEATLLKQFQAHPHIRPTPDQTYYPVVQLNAAPALRPVVVGFGPCGIFAALLLAQMGFKPIVLERGKKVRERTQDTWGLWRKSTLNPESNVQFGEGGAGTFSDGKLWSQIKDPRHLGRKVMMEFVKAGAPPEMLTAACSEHSIDFILPAHGYVIGQAKTAIAQLKAHRLKREAKIMAVMEAMPDGTLDDWVPLAYDDVDERIWPVAKRSLLAHVERIRAVKPSSPPATPDSP